MSVKRALLFTLSLLYFSASAYSQNWNGIIAPTRAVDWSNAGVVGGIPTNRTQCGATVAPYSGAPTAINNAIAACGANQYVSLGAGTFNLTSMINWGTQNNVTLRGQGANSTFIVFSGGGNCGGVGADVCIAGSENYGGGPSNQANWTGGYTQGATSITLDKAPNLAVGNVISLDQCDDGYSGLPCAGAAKDPGGPYVCQTILVCGSEIGGGTGRPNRAQAQMVTVTSISGKGPYTVGITPGLYMPNWRSSQTPGAWWGPTISGNSVENLSLDHSNSTGNVGILFLNVTNSWVKGIRSIKGSRDHVWLFLSPHIVVRDSYFYGTQNAAEESYGVELFQTSDSLIENNIFEQVAAPIPANGSGSGTVIGYNFNINDYYSLDSQWMSAGEFLHSAGTDMILYEGNQGNGLIGDSTHGTHNFITAFRNYYTGWDQGQDQETIPIHLQQYSRYFNIIGNVLGTSTFHTNYQCVATTATSNCTSQVGSWSIFTIGYSGNEGQYYNTVGPDDPVTGTSLMRWGNYDTVNAAVRWVSSEVPSSINPYPVTVPKTQTLPKSFYLSAAPAFWPSGKVWPPIGPDVTGGNIPAVGGHANTIPAADCYASMGGSSQGTGSVLTFNPSSCYATTSTNNQPSPPTNLAATVN
jgi:hypothetical protein